MPPLTRYALYSLIDDDFRCRHAPHAGRRLRFGATRKRYFTLSLYAHVTDVSPRWFSRRLGFFALLAASCFAYYDKMPAPEEAISRYVYIVALLLR